jgi:hypothetical protein
MSPQSDLKTLATRLCADAEDNPDLDLAADRLDAQISSLGAGLTDLAPMVGGGVSLTQETSLEGLRGQLESLVEPLVRLLELVAPLLAARHDPAPSLTELDEAARVVTQAQESSPSGELEYNALGTGLGCLLQRGRHGLDGP